MSADAHISETRHGQILAELAGLGLSLARDLHARALAAETADEAARLASAFHRISRGVRQSLALEAKLGREHEAHDLQHAPLREEERLARVSRRRTQVFRTVERLIWNETEDDGLAGDRIEDLSELLDVEALDDDFLAEPLAQQIDRLRARLHLIGPAPEPRPEPAGDDPEAGDDDADADAFDASESAWPSPIAGLADPAAPAHPPNTS